MDIKRLVYGLVFVNVLNAWVACTVLDPLLGLQHAVEQVEHTCRVASGETYRQRGLDKNQHALLYVEFLIPTAFEEGLLQFADPIDTCWPDFAHTDIPDLQNKWDGHKNRYTIHIPSSVAARALAGDEVKLFYISRCWSSHVGPKGVGGEIHENISTFYVLSLRRETGMWTCTTQRK